MEDKELLEKLRAYKKLSSEWGLYLYSPYKKQIEFHNSLFRERALVAGNQLGKTLSAAHEVAYHMTGLYPDWWEGKRFDSPVTVWMGSETAELTRDGAQTKLLGPQGSFGTAAIPKSLLCDPKMARGTPGCVELFAVKHVSGGLSQGVFKAYADGREKWQAGTVHIVWMDEEAPYDIYTEALTRTNATNGIIMATLTPLKGMSDVVIRFLKPPEGASVKAISMTIDDVDHYSEEKKKEIIASYPPHEREARAKGIPMLGSGRVFPIPEEYVVVDDFVPPDHWKGLIGIDFGWDHPTAAVKLIYDPEKDCVYVTACYRQSREVPIYHAAAIKPWGNYPVSWPHDALQHDKGSGEQLASIYRKHGLKMLSERAQFPDDRGNGVEAGIQEMLERMQTGRWRVFRSCHDWFEEFRSYHRKDGKIVKEREDILSASRYGLMMLRYAQPKSDPPKKLDRYSRVRKKIGSWMSA